jgi:hypothetical protein
MRSLLLLPATVLLLLALFAGAATKDNNPASVTPRKASPFYCNVNALSPAERKRHFEELGPKLRSLRRSVRELENGYEFEYPGDTAVYQLVSEWAIQERRCCPFFEIAIRLEPEGGPLWLRLTGRPGTKDFIKADAAAWINAREKSGNRE